MSRALFLFFLVLFVSPYPASAEEGSAPPLKSITEDYLVRVWEPEEGYPQITATAVAESLDGQLWIASFMGLTRYDGHRFQRVTEEELPLLKGAMAQRLCRARDGVLWLGTNKGLARLGGDGTWTCYGGEQGFPDKGPLCGLGEDAKGNILIAFDRDLYLFDGKTFTDISPQGSASEAENFVTLATATDGTVWVVGAKQLWCWDGKQLELQKTVPSQGAFFLGATACKEGGLWLTEEFAVYKLRNGVCEKKFERPRGFAGDWVAMLEDSSGSLWLGGFSSGVLRFSPDDSVYRCSTEDGLQNKATIGLFEDREGNIWIGSNGGGIARLHPRLLKVLGEKQGLQQGIVNSLLLTAPGKFFAATHGGGVVFFNGERFEPSQSFDSPRSAATSWVLSLAPAQNGGYWAGLSVQTLWRFGQGAPQQIAAAALGGEDVLGLFVDSQKVLWIATNKGVARRLPDGVFERFGPQQGLPETIFHSVVEHQGQLIASGEEGGLYRFDATSKRFSPFPLPPLSKSELPGALTPYSASNGSLYVGAPSGEIVRIDASGKRFVYTRENGLPTARISSIIEDTQGDLWCGTEGGILRIGARSLDAVNSEGKGLLDLLLIDKSDGMHSACRHGFQPMVARDVNGVLYFGTLKGVAVVDPARIKARISVPAVSINSCFSDDRSLRADEHGRYTVAAGTMRLRFHVFCPALGAPERLTIQHMISGIDKGWVEVDESREIQLQDMKPGKYRLSVRVSNKEGLTSSTETEFTMEAFFWQTLWFSILAYSAGALTIVAVMWFFLRAHYRRQREHMKHQQELAIQREAAEVARHKQQYAESASKAKSDFLATMSHEIRTPLNGVIGCTDLLFDSKLDQGQRENLVTLRSSAEVLLSLVSDVLDFSKIEAGKLSLEVTEFEPRLIVEEVIRILGPKAHEKGLSLSSKLGAGLPDKVKGDPVRVRQVLLNLGANALKFTVAGSVELELSRLSGPAGQPGCTLRFSVRDTGIGIPADKQPQLFEKYSQVDPSTTRIYGGTGLGLAISKRLVELMGGQIGVQSKPGAGSLFWFDIPCERSRTNTAPARSLPTEECHFPVERWRGEKALVADDNAVNRVVLSRMLTNLGLQVVCANDGAEAVARFLKDPVRLAFLDCRMPEMNGFEAAQKLRELDKEGRCTIVAVTADASPEDRKECLAAGMHEYLSKPVSKKDLCTLLSSLDRGAQGSER